MSRVVATAFLSASLLSACSFSAGSKPSSKPAASSTGAAPSPAKPVAEDDAADVSEEGDAPSRTNPTGTPSRTNPKAKPVRTNPKAKPASYAEGIAAIDASSPSAFASAVALFVEFHPVGSTRASTLRLDLQSFLGVVEATTASAEATVRASKGLMAAACEGAGFSCGSATAADRAELEALEARGIRFGYGGEGTVEVAVDHASVATALDAVLDDASKTFLAATHASARLSESFDEGSFTGKPSLAVDALTQWETLVANPGPYAADAPKAAAKVRETYLRLCYDGEHQTPPCKAGKALRASYAGFAKKHASSPSAPAVATFYKALRGRRWQATADQLDAMVTEALSASSS